MKKYQALIIIAAVSLSSLGGLVYVKALNNVPFVAKPREYSIGIYTGESPFQLEPCEKVPSPVLEAEDIADVPAAFVADPFMVEEGSTWYMFFEVMNAKTRQGDIGLATSPDGLTWSYEKIVLDEPFHISYPYVFKWQNQYYMIPESWEAESIRLYRAVAFPTQWTFVETLLYGDYVDPSVFRYDGKWWMFVGGNPEESDTLRLYWADDLGGPWVEHPESPLVIGDANIARPGGRVLVFNDRIFRYAQDDEPTYGNQVRMFEIMSLTTLDYEELEVLDNRVLKATGTGWNALGMHQIDVHQIGENKWIAAVDGFKRGRLVFGRGY